MSEPETLGQLDGYPFEVVVTRGSEARAGTLAARVASAVDWLAGVLDVRVEPTLNVLGPADWERLAEVPIYGMPHFGADGLIFVAATPPPLFEDVAAMVAGDANDAHREALRRVYGEDLDLTPFMDLLPVHELAHLAHLAAGVEFVDRWLAELFCNVALEGYVREVEPAVRDVLETLPLAAMDVDPARLPVTAIDRMADAYSEGGGVTYSWYELRLHAAAIPIWERGGADVLRRLLEAGRRWAVPPSLGQLQRVHPELARLKRSWPAG
ncbi:MAG: hypothetical protein L0227_03820 [Chloroflexi bacterium]|nr:hypothetical protein [Chloroflexota bacterium]